MRGANQAVLIPKDMEFKGIKTLEVMQMGDRLILQPLKKKKKRSWLSLLDMKPCPDFELDRSDDTRFLDDLEADGLLR